MDDVDSTVITVKFVASDKGSCCDRGGSRTIEGRPEISARELHKIGLGHLSVADLNGDGWPGAEDIAAFQAFDRPAAPKDGRVPVQPRP